MKNKKQQNQAIARILNNVQDQTYECNGLDQRGVASLIENQKHSKMNRTGQIEKPMGKTRKKSECHFWRNEAITKV